VIFFKKSLDIRLVRAYIEIAMKKQQMFGCTFFSGQRREWCELRQDCHWKVLEAQPDLFLGVRDGAIVGICWMAVSARVLGT